ncbi:hypothetical protein AB4K20DRAFT_1990834 [Rhizopus microsporus]
MSVSSPKSKLWSSLSSIDLSNSKETDMKELPEKFQQEIVNYEEGNWTRSGAINKIFIADLKNFNLEARNISTKALRLPTSVRYLKDEEEKYKDVSFDIEAVERIQLFGLNEAVFYNVSIMDRVDVIFK